MSAKKTINFRVGLTMSVVAEADLEELRAKILAAFKVAPPGQIDSLIDIEAALRKCQVQVRNAGDRAGRAFHRDSTFTRETEIGGEEHDSGDWWKED